MASKIDHFSFAVLINFQTEIDEIILDEHLRIVRLASITHSSADVSLNPDQLTMKVLKIRPILEQIPQNTFSHALEWYFSGSVPDPFKANYDWDWPRKKFSEALTSLRILKPGFIGRTKAPQSIQVASGAKVGPDKISHETLQAQDFVDLLELTKEPYILRHNDLALLKDIFKSITSSDNPHRIAISRFGGFYDRVDDSDKLIDLMIAFEALYLKGVKGELAFRLAARAATHLGNNAKERTSIFDLLKKVYDLRSEIVHGEITDLSKHRLIAKDGWSLKEILDELSRLMRDAFQSILLKVGNDAFRKDFHKNLDSILIQGGWFPKN